MNSALAKQETDSNIRIIQPSAVSVMEQVIIKGNLANLEPRERVAFYLEVCQSIGVNPLTQPFGYFDIDGVLTLYAKKDCTDQLRNIHEVTVKILSRELVDGVYVVTAQATSRSGRTDESIGAVPLVKEGGTWNTAQGSGKRYFNGDGTFKPLPPDARANAIMKAETKAKRRVTLSLIGLGLLDESELATIAHASIVEVDSTTGKIMGAKPVAIEAGPTASAETPASENGSTPEVSDWTIFWRMLSNRKIDGAAYESVVGAKAQSFPSPQAALDALREAEGAGTEPAPEQSDVIEVDGQQFTTDGEFVDVKANEPDEDGPNARPVAEKPKREPVAKFGEKPPAPMDQHTR